MRKSYHYFQQPGEQGLDQRSNLAGGGDVMPYTETLIV